MKPLALCIVVLCVLFVSAFNSLADVTSAKAEVYTHKSGSTYHTSGLVEHPTYAATGVTEDPVTGDPIDPPHDWSHGYGALGYGDIAGMAQSYADPDSLKAFMHLHVDKQTTERVRFYAWTNSSYTKTVKFEKPSEPNFFTAGSGGGTEYRVEMDFRVTGNIQENDISGAGIRSDVHLQLYNENANPPELEGEGFGWYPLITDFYAGDNDIDINGDYDTTATFPYSWIDKNWNSGEDYNGEPITFELLLWLNASEANVDGIGEGDVVMDFTSTCVLQSASLYEDDGQGGKTLLAEFDGAGNSIGGSQSGQWILTPEPGSLVLLGLGGLALLRRKR